MRILQLNWVNKLLLELVTTLHSSLLVLFWIDHTTNRKNNFVFLPAVVR